MAVDGSVVFEIDANVKQAEKKIGTLSDKIQKAGGKEINFSMNVSDAEKKLAEIRQGIEETERQIANFFGDKSSDEYRGLTTSLKDLEAQFEQLIRSSDEAFQLAMGHAASGTAKYTDTYSDRAEEINRYLESGTDALAKNADAISEKLSAAAAKVKGLEDQGLGLGYKEYDEAYRAFALLVAEAKKYQAELAKTPEQMEREAEIAQRRAAAEALAAEKEREREERRQQQIADQAAAAIAAQEAERRLLEIKESAVVSDQHIVDIQKELVTLTQRRKELEAAGVGAGHKEYDQIVSRMAAITEEVKEYHRELAKTPAQLQREAEIAQKKAEAEALAAQKERERQEAEQRLINIKENAVVADQHIVDIQQELATLTARRAELERAGVGIGHQEYNQILQRVQQINGELKEYQNSLLNIQENTRRTASSTDGLSKRLGKIGDRLKRMISRVFVFTLMTSALRSIRTWMGNVVKTNSEATAAIAKLKGALLTLAQPLVNVIIPAFITLVNVLTKVATVMANIMSKLFGTTIQDSQAAAKSLYEEMNALEDVGDAAKNAGKSMASFDEINQIPDQSASAESNASTEIAPDFTFMDSFSDELKEKLEEISEIVLFIGTGFALWKISDLLPGALGDIGSKLGLIMIAFAGLTLAINGIAEAWNNGVDWLNMAEIIGGVVIAAIALYAAFGPVAAGITLIVGGLAMLSVGFHDVMENGWNLQNTFLTIAGILATGIGISLLVGSFIPALIAAIVGLLVGIAVATGHGEELIGGVKKVLEGFGKFFEGDFAGGIALVLEGLTGIVGSIVDGLIDLVHGFFQWLDEKTGGQFHDVIQSIVGLFDMMVLGIREIFGGLIDFITGVFTGDWELAFNGLVTFMDGVAALLLAPILTAINFVIDGLNVMIRGLNKISFDIPDWVPELGGKKFGFNIQPLQKFEIPALAQGAVIPPNREFLAVLGDQKRGTNIEAPAELIQQMVTEGIQAAMRSGSGRDIYITLEMDRRVFAKAVYKANSEESQRVGVSFAGV